MFPLKMQFELPHLREDELTLETYRFGVVLSPENVVVRLVRYEIRHRASIYAPWRTTDSLWVWPDMHNQSTVEMPDIAFLEGSVRAFIANLVKLDNLQG